MTGMEVASWTPDYLMLAIIGLTLVLSLYLGGLLVLVYVLKYQSVPSIFLKLNNEFERIGLTAASSGQKFAPPSRVLFFPDSKGPCMSYIKSFDSNAGRVKCYKKDCDLYHLQDAKHSSFMYILERLRNARQVDLCMYRFSIKEASDVLISLHRAGAKVRIITDTAEESFATDQIPRLKSEGIRVREMSFDPSMSSRERPLMHNKFVIINKRLCLAGSFNWTWKALSQNQEMVIECHEQTVVQPLQRKFEELWKSYKPDKSQAAVVKSQVDVSKSQAAKSQTSSAKSKGTKSKKAAQSAQ